VWSRGPKLVGDGRCSPVSMYMRSSTNRRRAPSGHGARQQPSLPRSKVDSSFFPTQPLSETVDKFRRFDLERLRELEKHR
jgi:hypothetical protein